MQVGTTPATLDPSMSLSRIHLRLEVPVRLACLTAGVLLVLVLVLTDLPAPLTPMTATLLLSRAAMFTSVSCGLAAPG